MNRILSQPRPVRAALTVLLSFSLLAGGSLRAQSGDKEASLTIEGKVINFEESFPLEGAAIRIKGTDMITGTQADGTFNLPVSAADKVLVVSLSGYETREIPLVKDARFYDIVLKRAASVKGILKLMSY